MPQRLLTELNDMGNAIRVFRSNNQLCRELSLADTSKGGEEGPLFAMLDSAT